MLFRQIRYFIAVVDCNSFTEAAERCYISQSAISQQIQALESELGVPLLVRKGRRFSLTPAGEYFYNRGKTIVEDAQELCRETIRIGQDDELVLRIGYLSAYGGRELYEAVAGFSRSYPEVSINIVNGTHEELYFMLRQGQVDMLLSDQRRAFDNDYVNYSLSRCQCYAELSVRDPLSSHDIVTLDELKYTPCILVASKEQRDAEQEFYKNTLGFGGSFLFAQSLEEGRLMVVGNQGFLPVDHIGTLPPEGGAVRRRPIYRDGHPILRHYCAFWRKTHTNYYIEEFAGMMYRLLNKA